MQRAAGGMRAAVITVALAAATPAVAERVVVAPLASLTEDATDLAALDGVFAEAVARLDGVEAVPLPEVQRRVRRARRPQLLSCESNASCLAELGKLAGATQVLAGEAGWLTEGVVVYLRRIDVAAAREAGATTAVLPRDPARRLTHARAAAVRLLRPDRYLGALAIKVDVPGASVFLDGQLTALDPRRPLRVPVGTHALRVTHPKYRDFVRFVEVPYNETVPVSVDMTAYPVVSDEMRERARLLGTLHTGPTMPRPWYREWWAVAGLGAAAALTVGVVVYAATPGVGRDKDVVVGE